MPLDIVVHHLVQAKAALRTAGTMGVEIELRSAPGAAGYAGVGYLKALGEAVDRDVLVDCQEDAGLLMAALRAGCRHLVFTGEDDERQRLQQMAERYSATISGPERASADSAPRCLFLSPDDGDVEIRLWLEAQSRY